MKAEGIFKSPLHLAFLSLQRDDGDNTAQQRVLQTASGLNTSSLITNANQKLI
jgi:hypothetical protein